MPNTKSANKRLRQNLVRRLRNRAMKSSMKTQVKRFMTAIKEGQLDEAETAFRLAQKKIDRIGARRVIHPNKAARMKSQLSQRLKQAKATASTN